MNDEFLHQIRIEPPRRFIAALKARLDRTDLRRTKRMWFRHSFIAAAIGISGLAVAIMVVNLNRTPIAGSNAIAPPRPAASDGYSATPHGSSASGNGTVGPQPTAPSPNQANSSVSAGTPIKPMPDSGVLVFEGMRIMGPSALAVSLKETTRILNISRPFTEPTFSIADSDSAIAALCNVSRPIEHNFGTFAGAADAVGATRRISNEELKRCESNGVKHVAEIKLGYLAVVLARSRLYPALNLTARDLFLALAREIPDPEQPQRLIANPNVTWNQVNSALAAERIDISGPALDSDTVTVFRDLIMEPGCSTFASLAALKEKDRIRYDDVCKSLRSDGIYHGMNSDLFGQLDAHPESLALVDFRYFAANGAHLIGVSVDEVEPSSTALYAGSYPGSRPLYLYANVPRVLVVPRMREFVSVLQGSIGYGSGSSSPISGSESDRRESREAALNLPDVKL
jgi:ABC-type phosphate transport system substrate-binding protein